MPNLSEVVRFNVKFLICTAIKDVRGTKNPTHKTDIKMTPASWVPESFTSSETKKAIHGANRYNSIIHVAIM
jgi:hypothetical protein